MSPVLLQSRPNPVRQAGRVAGAVIVVLFLLSLVGLFELVRAPALVDRVTIDNESSVKLSVAVSSGDGSRMPLTVVESGREATVTEVLDQGDRWVFVLTRAGERVGVVRIDRSQLEADGWRVVVPASVAPSTAP